MKVYLAGKVDERCGAWRDAILGTRSAWEAEQLHLPRSRWVIGAEAGDFDWENPPLADWPVGERWILGHHDYVGPYRQTITDYGEWKSLGEWHGVISVGQHGTFMSQKPYRLILGRCQRAVMSANIFFAYINSPDAYGTLVELGYATMARRTFTVLLVHPDAPFDGADFWFPGEAADAWIDYPVDRTGRPLDEAAAVVTALKDAFVQYSAWKELMGDVDQQSPTQPDTHDASIRASFEQIARWSADPRVRNEAQRMIRQLSA